MMKRLGRTEERVRNLSREEIPPVVRQVMDVQAATEEEGVFIFRGRLMLTADRAFQMLRSALSSRSIPVITSDDKMGAAIMLVSREALDAQERKPIRWWLHILLLVLTLATTTFAGAMFAGVNLLEHPEQFGAGLPYALSLMAILGLHELGHYAFARRHKMNVTPPFFIPVPFFLGTFGAFIQMRSPSENRNMLFDTAVAGPLTGLIASIVVLLLALPDAPLIHAERIESPGFVFGAPVGGSMLFGLLAQISMGERATHDALVQLTPMAFAGWLGLIVTVFNLLPIGQLDGGHITQALFGHRIAQLIGMVAMWGLVVLAILVAPAFLIWALVIFFIAGRSQPPLNDITPLSPRRFMLGVLTYILFAMIVMPLPR